jgi:di/tricarboxylate transporter
MAVLEPHAVAAMAIAAGALYSFTRERFPIEYSCIGVLFFLVAGFEIFPYRDSAGNEIIRGADFLAGFGNEALITICLLLMAVKAVDLSGALRPIGRLLVRLWSRNRSLALLLTLSIAAGLSAFVNNTPIVVMLMPILAGVAYRVGMAPSRVLMPFCFATTMGGMTTTIGSSTNLLVVNVAADLGLPRIGMFDFVVPAGIALIGGILYLWLLAPRWLVDRPTALTEATPRIFYAVIEVRDDSPFTGRTLGELTRGFEGRTRIERVQRGDLDLVRLPSLSLRSGDKLHLRGPADAIKRLQGSLGGELAAERLERGADQRLVEIVVTRTSALYGKRFSQLRDGALGELIAIGIRSPASASITPIEEAGDPRLGVGDVLLLQGRMQDVSALKAAREYLVLDRTIHVPRTATAGRATLILGSTLLAAALGLVPIVVSALCAVSLMLFTRCLHWDEAWRAIDKRLALVIVTCLALGTALTGTGATAYIAERFVDAAEGLPAPVMLSTFLLMIALLNELLSNNAVAVIGTPIAVSIAEQLGVPALPFVLAVLFGANAGYITPIGYQTNLLVFTAGGYKFSDFVRIGVPLQLITWAILSVVLPLLYL